MPARLSTRRHRSGLAAAAAAVTLASPAAAALQDPDIGPITRVDTLGDTLSADETTASASDVNPNEIVAGWNDYRPDGTIRSGFSLSLDAGQTWESFILRPPAGRGSQTEGDPMSAFDPRTGTLWAAAISFSSGGGIYVARKDPGETEFHPSVMAEDGFVDKCWMAAGPRPGEPNSTRVYIAYNLGVIWSDDMGQTWTNPRSLGDGIGFLPRVGPQGELYVAYWDFGDGMKLKRSLDGGATFSTHTIATRMDTWGTQDGSRFPGTFRVPPLVTLDVDQNTGTLYATYFDTTDIVGGNRNVDLYFTKSTDNGTTWSTPVVINTDADPPGDQFFSWIEADSEGRLNIVFFDSRHTPQNDGVTNGMFDAYYMFSDDGGDTWSEFRLTPDPWNSADDGILGSFQFLGDYLGMAAAAGKLYPIYIDTSAGRAQLFTRVVTFGGGTTINSVDVTTGAILDGGVDDLRNSDDSYLHTRSGFGQTFIDLHNMTMVVNASTTVDSPATLDLTIESRIDEPAGTARVSLRNWNTGEFEPVDTFPVGDTDDVHVIADIDATNYVNTSGGGEIDLQLRHVVFVPFLAFTFESFIDHVEIAVE